MERVSLHLALHGMSVLVVSIVAGLVLWRVLYRDRDGGHWHLVHASGSVRGVLLIALAAVIDRPALPEWLAATAAWLFILFAWTSVVAMILRAITGDPGFYSGGSPANKVVFVLYAVGTAALAPACAILIAGFARALWLQ
jgi:hypothetical protein